MICIKCPKARFPKPDEQCYKWGGLICTVDDANVDKYATCRFGQYDNKAGIYSKPKKGMIS